MATLDLKKHHSYLVFGLVVFFSLFAFWLRILPMFNMGNNDILSMVASDDPLYNLRQVEQLLHNNLAYSWFDPMTLYPSGSSMYWGPLFPIIIAICCIITGATTRPEIIGIALIVPPLMGAATVCVMYYVGKNCGDWKTGLLSAGFTAIVSGQYFSRSLYGYIDHHIAEVLFSAIFCLFYMYALLLEKDQKTNFSDFNTYKKTLLFSILAGVAYLLGLFIMPTMILFALIAGIFTVVQFIIDNYKNRTSEYLLVINGTVFVLAIIGLLIFGLKNVGMDLSAYTIGHIFAYIGMIAGTALLYFIQIHLRDKQKIFYPAALLGCGIVFAGVLYFVSPQLYSLLIQSLFAFFGQAPVTDTVQEARGWSTAMAWITFNYGLILMLGGILVMIYKNTKDEHPEQVFALVWSVIMLASTIQHVRYEYYLAINIALLAAVCLSFTYEIAKDDIRRTLGLFHGQSIISSSEKIPESDASANKKQKKGQKKNHEMSLPNYMVVAGVVVIVVLSILFVWSSVIFSYSNASGTPNLMNANWKESLEWMGQNTADTKVDYYTIYNPKNFQYPAGSYGVMSWWDYGHMITYIAKRIPNANPFQQGVAGDMGAAAYFMTSSETAANHMLDTLGTRYIITDIEMDSGKFWAMSTWYNASVAASPYMETFLIPADESGKNYQPAQLNTQEYYLTTISRLHNFDGSMTVPSNVYYIEYADPQTAGTTVPVVVNAVSMNTTAASQKIKGFNSKTASGYHATVLSPSIIAPLQTVPALQHYRLVHESPTNVFNSPTVDMKYVKTFEYVKGAHIKGEGIIEVPVVSNTGRNFTYRQESINGEFIVPYSTTGNPYDAKTTSKYQIVGSNRQYDVPESAVMHGTTVQ